MSWVGLADVVAAILFAAETPGLSGPVNVAAPNPVINAEFTRVLGNQLHRSAFLTVPAFALHLMFGQMADEALLASARVRPAKLQAAGFRFSLPLIQDAVRAALLADAVIRPRAKTRISWGTKDQFGSGELSGAPG